MDAQYRNAIGKVESDNNYAALGPETDDGDRAYGRYQVMGKNIPEWTQRHLGTSMTPQQFLKDTDAQDKVFDGETSSHFKKYGNLNDVTSTWFSGRPMAQAGNASDGYNTVPEYVSKVNAAYGGNDGRTAIQRAMKPSSGSKMATPDDNTNGVLSSAPPPGPLTQSNNGWLSKLGDIAINMAPGLASISDPERANALSKIAAANAKPAEDKGTWSMHTLPNGQMVRINSKTGQPQLLPGNYAAPEKPEKDKVKEAADIGRVKEFQDLSAEIAKNGASSREALNTVQPIEQALANPNVPQGFGGELRATANKATAALPGATPEHMKTAADTDVAVAGINKMVQEGRTLNGGMPGSLSDKDLVFLKQSQAGLGNTPEGNKRIIEIYKQLHNRRVEMDDARQAYLADTEAHPLGLDEGFRSGLNKKWAAENAARDKSLMSDNATPTSASHPTLPKGVKSIQIIQ